MSLTLVQQAQGTWTAGTSFTVTLGSNPTTGNILVATLGSIPTSVSVASITRTGGGLASVIRSAVGRDAEIWFETGITGGAGAILTFNMNGSQIGTGATVSEYSWSGGSMSGWAAGTTNHNNATSTTPNTNSVTPTAGSEALLIIVTRAGAAFTSGPNGGFTALTDADTRTFSGYQFVTSASGSYAGDWVTVSGSWEAVIASFLPSVTAAVTGTATSSMLEADVVAGGKTIILTLTNDTFVSAGANFDAQRQNIINGIDSAQAEAHGWDVEVKAKEVVSAVVRTSNTVCTITLSAAAAYAISVNETITVTIPGTAVTGGNAIVATPTFTVTDPSAGQTTSLRLLRVQRVVVQ